MPLAFKPGTGSAGEGTAMLLSNCRLRTKLLWTPVTALLIIFLFSGILISMRVEKALVLSEESRIIQLGQLLVRLFENDAKDLENSMKVAALQNDLYEAYFALITEDDMSARERFLGSTREIAGVDKVLVVNESGTVTMSAMPEERGETVGFLNLLDGVKWNHEVLDTQNQLNTAVYSRLWVAL